MGRRTFLTGLGVLAASGAAAQQVPTDDGRLMSERTAAGYFVKPRPRAGAVGPETVPGILLVPGDGGLTPAIENVARRLALESFMVLAVDPATAATADALSAAAVWLKKHRDATGRIAVAGIGAGRAAANALAKRMGNEVQTVVTFDAAPPLQADAAWDRAVLQLIKSLT